MLTLNVASRPIESFSWLPDYAFKYRVRRNWTVFIENFIIWINLLPCESFTIRTNIRQKNWDTFYPTGSRSGGVVFPHQPIICPPEVHHNEVIADYRWLFHPKLHEKTVLLYLQTTKSTMTFWKRFATAYFLLWKNIFSYWVSIINMWPKKKIAGCASIWMAMTSKLSCACLIRLSGFGSKAHKPANEDRQYLSRDFFVKQILTILRISRPYCAVSPEAIRAVFGVLGTQRGIFWAYSTAAPACRPWCYYADR